MFPFSPLRPPPPPQRVKPPTPDNSMIVRSLHPHCFFFFSFFFLRILSRRGHTGVWEAGCCISFADRLFGFRETAGSASLPWSPCLHANWLPTRCSSHHPQPAGLDSIRVKPSAGFTPSVFSFKPCQALSGLYLTKSFFCLFFCSLSCTSVQKRHLPTFCTLCFFFCSPQKMLLKKNCGGKTRTMKIRVSLCFQLFVFSPCQCAETLIVRHHDEDIQFVAHWHLVHTGDARGGIPSILLCVCENDCNCGLNRLGESPQHCYCHRS